jgi:hypothetical protein
MDYFVLKADKKLKESQSPYRIPGCKDSMLNIIDGMIPPTAVSVSNRHLEWLIPNNQLNQQHISTHYSHFSILKAGEESTNADVKLMPGMPKPAEPKKGAEKPTAPPEKPVQSNDDIKKLKAKRVAELKELGVDAPKNSSLPKLDELLNAKREEILNS